jgi:serralysin
VTFSGNAFDTPITVKIYPGSTNVKLDVVDGDTIYSSISLTLISGAAGVNLLGIANLKAIGSAANETLNGNNGNNTLDGGAGKDALNGNAGRDVLIAGDGHDVITGGTGNDILRGGLGRDIMKGDKDADDFDFNSVAEIGNGATRDIVRDFEHLVDDIDLSTIDANGAAAGHAFTFLAPRGAVFTGAAGQLRWFQENLSGTSNDKTIVEGDINGDAIADFQIQLSGLKTLTSADFVL